MDKEEINTTTNDYDALDQVRNILKEL